MMNEDLYQYNLPKSNLTRQNFSEWKVTYNKMNNWCHTNCKSHWFADNNNFWFSSENDYTLFLLTWS